MVVSEQLSTMTIATLPSQYNFEIFHIVKLAQCLRRQIDMKFDKFKYPSVSCTIELRFYNRKDGAKEQRFTAEYDITDF